MNVAQRCREEKDRSPELYCPAKNCLWRTVTRKGLNPCRNHPESQTVTPERADEIRRELYPEMFRPLACATCGGQLNREGKCDADSMTTAEIARLVWDLEQIDAVNGSPASQHEIDQLNIHLQLRLTEPAHV